MNIKKWLKLNTYDLTNQTIAITGSTGGLGTEIVKILLSLNADLVLLNRNLDKSLKQKQELLALYPKAKIEIIETDLSSIASVKLSVESLRNFNIDILIHNAGIYNVPLDKTSSGYNNVFQTNFISPYYLTKEFIKNSNVSKIVVVSSIAHNYSKINFDDIDFSKSKKASKVYGNSKRFLTFAMQELFKDLQHVKLSIVHPGITLTNMTNHYPKAINWLVKFGIKILFPKPKQASLNIIKGVFYSTNYHEWIGPKTFNIWGRPQKKKLNTASAQESKQIFEIAEKIYEKIKNSD